MAGDGDEPTLDARTKEMIEGFLGVPLDKNHEFWNPPPLTPEQEAALEDAKRRAELEKFELENTGGVGNYKPSAATGSARAPFRAHP